MKKLGFKELLVIVTLILNMHLVAYAQNQAPVITELWIDVDYYDYCDWWWYCCDEYAVIKGHVSAYDPDGDSVFYTWYIDGLESGYGDSLWYETWREGWYEIYVKVKDTYGLSTWSGPYKVRVDFDWWCGGGCSLGSSYSSNGWYTMFPIGMVPFLILLKRLKRP